MYYPKSHITTDLYSNGEFVFKGSTQIYTGYYFSTIDGTYFTGRFPNDGNNLELTNLSPAFDIHSYEEFEYPDYRFVGKNYNYSILNKVTGDSPNLKPTPFYPNPSTQDYKLGEFTRYFSKKTNENKYVETSGLVKNSLYIGFSIPWLISGDKEEVARVNKNMVILKEERLRITGFGDFLKHNYLKFYK